MFYHLLRGVSGTKKLSYCSLLFPFNVDCFKGFEKSFMLPQGISFNPLQPAVPFLYPLKTSENLDVLRGYRKATPAVMG